MRVPVLDHEGSREGDRYREDAELRVAHPDARLRLGEDLVRLRVRVRVRVRVRLRLRLRLRLSAKPQG